MLSSSRSRTLLRSAVAAIVALGAFGIATAAGAMPTPGAGEPRIAGLDRDAAGFVPQGYAPQKDHLGSQIAKHAGKSHVVISPDAAYPQGLDVSSHQGNVDWNGVKANGASFAYVKATESNNYRNPYFSQQYSGSYNAGLIRGAYHFAIPNATDAVTQANYFVDHGGGWSADGKTLPPMLDIEYNPYGATCYGLSQSSMVSWINAFLTQVHARTSRWATIYTNLDWWNTCTGNSGAFHSNDPLFVARYSTSPGTLPGGWGFWTFWQYSDSGKFPGDQDYFNGSAARLVALANNTA